MGPRAFLGNALRRVGSQVAGGHAHDHDSDGHTPHEEHHHHQILSMGPSAEVNTIAVCVWLVVLVGFNVAFEKSLHYLDGHLDDDPDDGSVDVGGHGPAASGHAPGSHAHGTGKPLRHRERGRHRSQMLHKVGTKKKRERCGAIAISAETTSNACSAASESRANGVFAEASESVWNVLNRCIIYCARAHARMHHFELMDLSGGFVFDGWQVKEELMGMGLLSLGVTFCSEAVDVSSGLSFRSVCLSFFLFFLFYFSFRFFLKSNVCHGL